MAAVDSEWAKRDGPRSSLHRQVSKESVLEKDVSGRLPLHIAFQNGAPIELIDLLLKNNHPVCLPPAVASG